MPIVSHLKEMYKRENFFDNLQGRFHRQNENNVIADIYDAELYKEYFNNGFLSNPHNISLSWYTDGIPVFKSSKISSWPIYLTINELPFHLRKQRCNTLLLGLWFGEKKPHFNFFIYTFRPVLEKLFTGVQITLPNNDVIIVRAILLMGVCDLPAKCECANFVQFNGRFGCPVCFFEGQITEIGPRSHLQVYPFTDNFELKTLERCIQLADVATPDNPQFGIKGHTALCKLMPDFIRGMCIDRMHAVDGGVEKKILILMFHNSYKNQPFSLYEYVNIINLRLRQIKPPKFIHRLPRTVDDLIHWKASELKNFLYYYSVPIFERIMAERYFNHYLLLITAMFLLSADEISHNMIEIAQDFLRRFVREFDELYGIRYSSINVHLLLHFSNSVVQQGPLWAHTCYEYEDMNGQILNVIHGTRYIASQVANSHNNLIKMIKDMEEIENEDVRNYCLNKKKTI